MRFDDDFFKTETRDGFEVPSMMKRAWAAQMEVLKVVSDICNRNGIRYFADFGTLLGAVRHKGMIPWDDDIDICLMRNEYNKLIRILPEELPEGFVIAGMYAKCERLQNAAFARQLRVIADEEIWGFNEYMIFFHGFPYQRVGIDIFPIDYISRDENLAQTQREMVKFGIEILKNWDELKKSGDLIKCLKKFEKIYNVDLSGKNNITNDIWKLIDSVSSLCCSEESDYVTNFGSWVKRDNFRIRKECYNSIIKMPFENFEVNVPIGYKEVLKVEFGEDYMLPKKGKAGHDYPFYGHMEQELIKQIRNVGFKGTVDEFCEEVSSGRLRV